MKEWILGWFVWLMVVFSLVVFLNHISKERQVSAKTPAVMSGSFLK